MSLRIVSSLLALLLFCACPGESRAPGQGARAVDSTRGESEITLRLAWLEPCPHCVSIQSAVYGLRGEFSVHESADCSVTRNGVYRIGGRPNDGNLILALNKSGKNGLRSCRALVTEKDAVHPFLVFYVEEVIGSTHLFSLADGEIRTLEISSEVSLELIARSLNPENTSLSALDHAEKALELALPRRN